MEAQKEQQKQQTATMTPTKTMEMQHEKQEMQNKQPTPNSDAKSAPDSAEKQEKIEMAGKRAEPETTATAEMPKEVKPFEMTKEMPKEMPKEPEMKQTEPQMKNEMPQMQQTEMGQKKQKTEEQETTQPYKMDPKVVDRRINKYKKILQPTIEAMTKSKNRPLTHEELDEILEGAESDGDIPRQGYSDDE